MNDKQVSPEGTNKRQNLEPNPEQMGDKLPATGMAENPDPRANENIGNRDTQKDSGVGSEITDGEDA